MTTTEEQFEAENSAQASMQVQNSPQTEQTRDTSDITSEPQIPQVIKEPASNTSKAVKPIDEFEEIPQKFKNKDGSANVSALIKSYKALEPLINEKAKWTKEKESLTSQLSKYQLKDPDAVSDLSKKNVELLSELIDEATDIEKAKSLIEQFNENPTNEIIKELESLFPYETLKKTNLEAAKICGLDAITRIKQMRDAHLEKFHGYLKDVVEKNFETLKNPVTAEIFGQALMLFGSGFDSEWFFSKMQQLKESFYTEYQKEQSLKTEADSALLTASKMSPKNSMAGGVPLLERNALDLSPQELDKMLDEYYAK